MKAFLAWVLSLVARPSPSLQKVQGSPIPPAPADALSAALVPVGVPPRPVAILLPRDEHRLKGVHPDLVRVVKRARKSASFIVTEGLRTHARQRELFQAGASRTMNSRHLTGHAVDLAAWVDSNADGVPGHGEVRWDWPLYDKLGEVMKEAAQIERVPIVWGGDWTSFRDGPHFELDRRHYPA
jgi:peptidoglycan LD-endopeptidase CwlK